MKIELTPEEAHWLKYVLIIAIDSAQNDLEKKQIYLSVIEKISQSQSKDEDGTKTL